MKKIEQKSFRILGNGDVKHLEYTAIQVTKDVGDEIGERKSITYIFSHSGGQVDRIPSPRGE